jgi:hypothetical protein
MRQPTHRTIEWTVEHYVLSRSGRRPVSTRDAIRALRAVMHKCALSDRELTDLVAKCAIQRRLDVNFDGYPDLPAEGLLPNHDHPSHSTVNSLPPPH